jgi:hypothetical protein
MQVLQGISQSMKSVSGSSSMDDFARVSSELVQTRDKVREELQAATADAVTKILKKLGSQELLTPEERNLVELWIVGDAEGYTKMENNFGEWQEEFRRLGGVLESYAGQASSPQRWKCTVPSRMRFGSQSTSPISWKRRIGSSASAPPSTT